MRECLYYRNIQDNKWIYLLEHHNLITSTELTHLVINENQSQLTSQKKRKNGSFMMEVYNHS